MSQDACAVLPIRAMRAAGSSVEEEREKKRCHSAGFSWN